MTVAIRVLCVEDDPDDQVTLEDQFAGFDLAPFELQFADTLTAAQRLLVLEQFDLIIIDYFLQGESGTTGMDLANFLIMQGSRIPMLLVSGSDRLPLTARDEELLARGRLHFLRKEELTAHSFTEYIRRILQTPIQVLHVEDDPEDRQLVAELLEESPVYRFELRQLTTISEAVMVVSECRFDAYLFDYRLANGNGAELARQILRLDPSAAITLNTGLEEIHTDPRALSVIGSRRVGYLAKRYMDTATLVRSLVNSRNSPIYFAGKFGGDFAD